MTLWYQHPRGYSVPSLWCRKQRGPASPKCPLSLWSMALLCAPALLTTETGHSGGPSYECAKRLAGVYFVVFGTAGPDISAVNKRDAFSAQPNLLSLDDVKAWMEVGDNGVWPQGLVFL